MSTFFVINPAAGRGRSRQAWESIKAMLDGRPGWDSELTRQPGEETTLARRAADEGYTRVVAVGGDGTICNAAAGLVNTGAALGLIPAGTGNDYARSLGIPKDPVQAAQLALTGTARAVDIGRLERATGATGYFLNVAGIGFDAEVARSVNAFPKYLGGTIPYLLGILKTLWRYRPVDLELDLDGTVIHRRSLLVAVGIAQYYGGGMWILPEAKLDDGLFDVCVAGDLGRGETLSLVPKIYSAGHVGHPKVEFHRCRRLRITPATSVAIHTDGELVGAAPVTLSVMPLAIRVVAPPAASRTDDREAAATSPAHHT